MNRSLSNQRPSTAIFVDTNSTDLTTYTVNVSRVPGVGLVVRCNNENEAKYLPELLEKSLVLPLIIPIKGHGTEVNGFVKVEGGKSHREYVVGITNFPFQAKPYAFRALPNPMEIIIVPAHTKIEKIPTNLNRREMTAHSAFQTIKTRCGTDSAIIAVGSNMLVRGWEIFLPAEDSDIPYFPDERQKAIFSVKNMVNAALRLQANRLDPDPSGGEGKHFIQLNMLLSDEAVGDSSWKDKLLPAYTRKLAGSNAETIISRLAQRMREEGWSLTIDAADKTLPLQAISPDKAIVASGPRLGNIKDRSYWKKIVINLCDGLSFEARKELQCRLSTQ